MHNVRRMDVCCARQMMDLVHKDSNPEVNCIVFMQTQEQRDCNGHPPYRIDQICPAANHQEQEEMEGAIQEY